MITLRQCAQLADLDLETLIVGVEPEPRHQTLLQSYRLNMHRGHAVVRCMIVNDLLGYIDIGAHRVAADLLIVLRLFLSEESRISHASRRRAFGQCAAGFDPALSSRPSAVPPVRRGARRA